MPDRLSIDDAELFPVQAFFNAVGNSYFVEAIASLIEGVGFSMNDAYCSFPSELDEGEEPFEGVRFSLYEDSATISRSRMLDFMRIACAAHIESQPADKETLERLLERASNDLR